MNFLAEILLMVGVVVILGLLVSTLTKLLSTYLIAPLLSKSDSLFKHTTEKEDKFAYLEYIVKTSVEVSATRESANISPRVRLQDVFVVPFFSDEQGNSVKFFVDHLFDSKSRNFLIVGNAGSGKTSLLRHIELQISHSGLGAGGSEDPIIPFYLSLRKFQSHFISTLPALLEECTPTEAREKLKEEYFEKSLHKGRTLILLDGLDEIRNQKSASELLKFITGWSQMYVTCKFVVTSRPGSLESLDIPNTFRRLTLLPFSEGQITEFLRKWTNCVFQDLSEVLENPSSYQQNRLVLRRLALENVIMSRPELKGLASSPLLLTLMCTTHYFTGSIPLNRAFIFQESVSLLLNKIDADIPKHHLQFIVSQIAFDCQKNGITNVDEDFVRKAIERSKHTFSIDFATESVFSELVERSGLLHEHSPNQFSFVHYSFQEFFAAQYIIYSGIQFSTLKDMLNDQWWRDVIILAAEGMQEIDELCTDIINDDNIPELDKVKLVGQILASSKKVDRETRARIIRDVVSEVLDDASDEQKQQMLLLASPYIASEIITIAGDGEHE